LDVGQFKNKLLEIVDRTPYRFGALSDRDSLIKTIGQASSFLELIALF
jgi:hypothetical protein